MGLFQQLLPIFLFPLLLLVGYMTAKHIPKVYYPTSPLRFRVRQQNPRANGQSPNGDAKAANGTSDNKKYVFMTISTFLQSHVPRSVVPEPARSHPRPQFRFRNFFVQLI